MRGALRALRRRPLRIVFAVALLNLGWDLWSWRDRTTAEGDRRFFRMAERAEDIDRGLAEISIINETGRAFVIDSFVLDGAGAPVAPEPTVRRILAPMGEADSVRQENRELGHLVATGRLVLSAGGNGPGRVVTFDVDRRRPNSCGVELRIREADEVVSECRPLHRIRTTFRWLFGPPGY
jgi:hypothetical protein